MDSSKHLKTRRVPQSRATFEASTKTSTDSSFSPKYVNKKAVVVGAGPAGITAAVYLAKNGMTVEVYETRPNIMLSAPDSQRAISIILQRASASVLKDIGIDLPSKEGGYVNGLHTYKGRKLITSDGGLNEFPPENRGRFVGNRHDITCTLLDFVQTNYSPSVAFHFEHLCTKVSFDEQTVAFRTADQREHSVKYDLLVAADGINSIIRTQQEEIDKEFHSRLYRSRNSYKGLGPLSIPQNETVYENALLPGFFISYFDWQNFRKSKGSSGSLLYRMAADGTVDAIISAPARVFEEMEGKEEEWLLSFLPDDFPNEWKKEMCHQFCSRPARRVPSLLRLSKFIGPQTVFIGDAAHSVPPSLGFGMNMAIQDGRALNEALKRGDGDVDESLQQYNTLRYDEVQQIQTIEQNFFGARIELPVVLDIWQRFFYWHIRAYSLANQFFPKWTPMHPVLQIATERFTPREVMDVVRRDYTILSVLFFCGALLCLRQTMGT